MIQIFEVDSQGNILDSQIEQDDFQETTRLKVGWTGYLLKPIYDCSQSMWIESATDKELEAAVTYPKTNEERLGQQISTLEIDSLEKDFKIAELGKQNKEQGQNLGQQISDLELMILGGM